MARQEAQQYLTELYGWALGENAIEKTFTFKNFVEAMKFVNHIAVIAEQESHHPTLRIAYNEVTFDLRTHAIGGLSRNDFILAAKIDEQE